MSCPHSFQAMLFSYLKPKQRRAMRSVLRILRFRYQVDLCVALLDYLETGQPIPPDEPALRPLFRSIIDNLIQPLKTY